MEGEKPLWCKASHDSKSYLIEHAGEVEKVQERIRNKGRSKEWREGRGEEKGGGRKRGKEQRRHWCLYRMVTHLVDQDRPFSPSRGL